MDDTTKTNLPAPTARPGSLSSRALATMIPEGYEVDRVITRAVLQQIDGEPFSVKFETRAIEGQELKPQGRGTKMAPARVCDVLKLPSKEPCILIMNTVLESELDRAFPDGTYVGHSFAILRGAHPDANDVDKRYKLYRILELKEKASGGLESAGKGVIDATTKEAVDRAKANQQQSKAGLRS